MSLFEKHLSNSPGVNISLREYERALRAAQAKIESALYHAGVPEHFYRHLVKELSGFTRSGIGSALLLYEQLGQDVRLTEADRARLIPRLAKISDEHGAKVHNEPQFLDQAVDDYLTTPQVGLKPNLRGSRIRDRHASDKWIIYGDASAKIHYGTRQGGYGDTLKRKIPASRIPSQTMVRKAQELANSVNSGKWNEAIERYHDLLQQSGHLFYGVQTHRQFLYDVGSIIKGGTNQHQVALIGIDKYGFPTEYKLSPAFVKMPSEEPKEKPNREKRSSFVKRISRRARTVPSNGFGKRSNTRDVVVLSNPHPSLERVIGRTHL